MHANARRFRTAARANPIPGPRGQARKMAPQLCCVADEDGRSSSPDLPNARLSEAADTTPARRPLLHSRAGSNASHGSRFTSARTEDLHELQQIFNTVDDSGPSPKRASRARFIRPSVYSLHSLHKMKSVQALLGRRRSRDLSKRSSPDVHANGDAVKGDETETVVRTPKHGYNHDVQITKSDLRRDLLSDKKPEEGGYDSDAEILDDIVKKVAKKTPSKRPSLHSIDWTPTSENVRTPESTNHRRTSVAAHKKGRNTPRHSVIRNITPSTKRFSNVFSSPNLRILTPKSKSRKLKRSHSATSAEIPSVSPIVAIRLPSIVADEGVPWAQSMHESLRLSQVPKLPTRRESHPSGRFPTLKSNEKVADVVVDVKLFGAQRQGRRSISEPLTTVVHVPQNAEASRIPTPAHKDTISEETIKTETVKVEESVKTVGQFPLSEDGGSRSSVHLHNMHISQHLRSASLLSWDKHSEIHELAPPPLLFRDRTASEHSRSSRLANRSRHGRQTSSSGFASTKIPSKWGNVVPPSHQREDLSSIYSSRPHSPPDSLGGSMGNVSLPARPCDSTLELPRCRSSNLIADNEETPKSTKPHGLSSPAMVVEVQRSRSKDHLSEETPRPPKSQGAAHRDISAPILTDGTLAHRKAGRRVARHNSVANTKKSKFREEFSPAPPRKRSTPVLPFAKYLRHRHNMRSQSEANLKANKSNFDGPSDDGHVPTRRERAMSQSLMSMQKEEESSGKEKDANPVWQKALKSYQNEKSSLLLPGNRAFAGQSSPLFRERSSSISVRARSTRSLTPVPSGQEAEGSPTHTRPHTPLEGPVLEEDETIPDFTPRLRKRRTAALADDIELDTAHELRAAFDKQTDTIDTVGAWGRYPSHTRHDRTGSAGQADSVHTRDFALEAAIQFAKGADPDEGIDPTARPESPVSASGKKRKKKVGSGRMAKSTSMTFGKTFLRNYTKRFRSQSTEFHRHGYGHRSSIAAGGLLEHPELEMLPQVFVAPIVEDREPERSKEGGSGERGQEDEVRPQVHREPTFTGKGKGRAEDSMSTLRPPKINERHAALDGVADTETSADRARVWSIYYEDCVPVYPRASADLTSTSHPNLLESEKSVELQEFGAMPQGPGRHSLESKRTSIKSMRSHTVPRPYKGRHTRHTSHVSRVSITSRKSFAPSYVSIGGSLAQESGDGADESNVDVVSVRKSTLDLLNTYREQENTERERVLSLIRRESVQCV